MKHLLTTFFLLLALTCCTTEADRIRMRAGLDSINMRNRNDQPFTVSDVQPYVTFFDEHGTANDRLLAHYLLGRAYHDRGEAPMALQCYHDAIDCADTTAADCDYPQLARVYGQMGDVFYTQGLYRKALNSYDLSSKYAWIGCDTLTALAVYEQKNAAYMNLGYTDSAMAVINYVAKKYIHYGYLSDAAISLATIIRPLINNGEYKKAKCFMDKYETLSGYFDSHGNIEAGREIYYKAKGLYYLHINKLDSAEYFFRKELHDGKDYSNQNSAANGLALLYNKTHNSDSIAKYATYAYNMLDSLYAQRATKDIERIQAMYDYTRHKEIARQESQKAAEEKEKRQIISTLFILALIIAAAIIIKIYQDRKKKQLLYAQSLEQLEQIQSDILQLRLHEEEYTELLAEKENMLEKLRHEIEKQKDKELLNHLTIEKRIKESDIYQLLMNKQYKEELSVCELRDCRKLVIETLPEFSSLLFSKKHKISPKDFNVCMLLRLGFKSKEVSNMMGITQGRVSQICAKVLLNVFKKDTGGVTELTELLYQLY